MLNDLENLENIIHLIKEDNNNYLNDDESLELYTLILFLVEEFISTNPKIISYEDFEELLDENIRQLIYSIFDDDIFFNNDAEEEIDYIIDEAIKDIYKDIIVPRSLNSSSSISISSISSMLLNDKKDIKNNIFEFELQNKQVNIKKEIKEFDKNKELYEFNNFNENKETFKVKELLENYKFKEDKNKKIIKKLIIEKENIEENIDNNNYNNEFKENNLNQNQNQIQIQNQNIILITNKLNYLRSIPQPVQRTKEWYEFRHNLITASNAYKAFESQKIVNSLIYEKCLPLNNDLFINKEEQNNELNIDNIENIENIENKEQENIKMVNTNTTLHWGQKYEPLSVMLYENIYNTKIEDFGCIKHNKYYFIGASPDGINVDVNSNLYGRMLEIKNIVNRKIDGIPKKEYWIQMQLQMEVCDLNECDFLETKFIEYENYNSFINDSIEYFIFNDNNTQKEKNIFKSVDGKRKGIIIHFHNSKEGKPFYLYQPLEINNIDAMEKWQEENLEIYQNPPYNYTFLHYLYWKCEQLSCVLVQRNKEWFENNIKELQKVWSIIEKERIEGYEHRAPTKRVRKNKEENKNISKNENIINSFSSLNKNSGCLLKVKKLNNENKEICEKQLKLLENLELDYIIINK